LETNVVQVAYMSNRENKYLVSVCIMFQCTLLGVLELSPWQTFIVLTSVKPLLGPYHEGFPKM